MIISEKFCHTDEAGNGYIVDMEGNIKKTNASELAQVFRMRAGTRETCAW